MAGGFCLPWGRAVLVWNEIWATPPPLKEWGFRLVGTLSQGCPRMKRAQPSLDARLGQRAEDSPLLHLLQSLATPPPPVVSESYSQ